MQLARGFLYFETKTLSDVKLAFGQFRFDEAVFAYFTSFTENSDKVVSSPGIVFSGRIKQDYGSEHIARLFRKLMNLEDKVAHCHITVENERMLKPVKTGLLYGSYLGLDVASPYTIDNLLLLADQLAQRFNAHDVCLREAGASDKKTSLRLEVISDILYEPHLPEITVMAATLNIKLTDRVLTQLFRAV